MLDFTAAVDSVDHYILIIRLHDSVNLDTAIITPLLVQCRKTLKRLPVFNEALNGMDAWYISYMLTGCKQIRTCSPLFHEVKSNMMKINWVQTF